MALVSEKVSLGTGILRKVVFGMLPASDHVSRRRLATSIGAEVRIRSNQTDQHVP